MAAFGRSVFSPVNTYINSTCFGTLNRNLATLTDSQLLDSFYTENGKPKIKSRPHLPGNHGKNLPEYLSDASDGFPAIENIPTKLSQTLSSNLISTVQTKLKQSLLNHGAVLFRGLPLHSAGDFNSFSKGLGFKPLAYIGGLGVRDPVASHVMTATREPPAYTLEPHNEMSYTSSNWPTCLWFFCLTPVTPGCGGESVLVRNKDLKQDLDPEMMEKFRRLGVRYQQLLPERVEAGYMSWQEVFQSEDKGVIEDTLNRKGYNFEWLPNNLLSYWFCGEAFRPHHATGEEIWFNQLHMNASYYRAHPLFEKLCDVPDDKMPYHTYYGDGTVIEDEVLEHIREVTWKNAVPVPYEKGDVLFMDNMAVQHGRLGYVGERRLLLSFTADTI